MVKGAQLAPGDDDDKKAVHEARAKEFAAKLMAALRLKAVVVPNAGDVEEQIAKVSEALYTLSTEEGDLEEFKQIDFKFTDADIEQFQLPEKEISALKAWRHPIDYRAQQKDEKLLKKKIKNLGSSIDSKLDAVLAKLEDEDDRLKRRALRVLKRSAKLAKKLFDEGRHNDAQAVLNGLLYLETMEKLAFNSEKPADAPEGEILRNEDINVAEAVQDRKTREQLAEESEEDRLEATAREVLETMQHLGDMRETAGLMRRWYAPGEFPKKSPAWKALGSFDKITKSYNKRLKTTDDILDHFNEDISKLKDWQSQAAKEVAAAEKILQAMFQKRAKDHEKKVGKYLKIKDHEVVQKEADATGHGKVKSARGVSGLPQEIMKPLSAELEVLQLISASNDLSKADFALLKEFEAKIKKELDILDEHAEKYKEYEKCAKRYQTLLDKSVMKYSSFGQNYFKDEFETLNEQIKDPEKLEHCLAELLATEKVLKSEVEHLERHRNTYKNFKDKFDKAKKDKTREFVEQFKKTLKVFCKKLSAKRGENEVRGIKLDAEMHKTLAEAADRKDYAGLYDGLFDKIWGTVDIADVYTVIRADPNLDKLVERIETKTNRLKRAESALSGLTDPMKADKLLGKLDNSEAKALRRAIVDIHDSGDLNDKIAAAKAEYKEARDAFDNYVKKAKKKMKGAARDSFSSNETLLKALKSRAKTATTPEDYNELQKEAERLLAEARDFADANVTLDMKDKVPNEKFALILGRLTDGLPPFFDGMDGFYEDVVPSSVQAAKKAADENPAAAEMRVIYKKKNGKDAVKAIAEQLSERLSITNECKSLIKHSKKAEMPELIALREEAFALIRRKRRFLEETKIGALYKTNPFDQGRPVRRLLYFLEKTEADLLAEVKLTKDQKQKS